MSDDVRRGLEMAAELWRLLDDIDTLDDACREHDAEFRKRCYAIQRKRFGIMRGEQFDAIRAAAAKLPPQWMQEELADGDRICKELGLERTEGGRLPMYKLLAKLRELKK